MPGGARDSGHPDAETLRRAYARHLLAYNGILDNEDLLRGFSVVPRERFLGAPPWSMVGHAWKPVRIEPDDLDHVYRDVLFALDAEKGINNGEPSLHARLIDALAPKAGDTIVHIGAGTGYYSAILAELVGPAGHVLAIEADARLGEMARTNLSDRDNVEVVVGDGAGYPRQDVEGVYVSFAVAAPAANWVEHLKQGGRLIFPLGVPETGKGGLRHAHRGAMLRVMRQAVGFAAEFVCPAAFIFGVAEAGKTDDELARRLAEAFTTRRARDVKSLIWHEPADPDRCWIHSKDWSLCYDPPGGG